ncbi:MAG: DedA family protein [Synergistaceae bacterium]|nr:DedA family protein [Synergistaceae bacterium]
MKSVTGWLVETIGRLGYAGIVALMFLESSFFPFPSEVVLPPAGYLAWKGEMSFVAVVACGIAGSILGALFNYWFALRFGRPFLIRHGRYFFVSESSIEKAESFFARHGHISTLVGRLLPVIRQYISLPAGVARMKLDIFILYTSIGAGLWAVILTLVGYLLGEHQELLERYLRALTLFSVACAVLLATGYLLWYRRSLKKESRRREAR